MNSSISARILTSFFARTASRKTDVTAHRKRRLQFWGRDPDDDRLLAQALDGRKTATAGLARDWDIAEGDYDDGGYVVGDLVEVYDRRGRCRCEIRITEVYETTFGAIPERLWAGECCVSAEDFRSGHRECWAAEKLSDVTRIVGCHFELVSVANELEPPSQSASCPP
ncbi:MAG TPA: ASCH domain-containing protein [Opitutaceae bacterium]